MISPSASSKLALSKTELHGALKRHFGFDAFRPGQQAIVEDALSGRDLFAIMPTGGGKSLCFQLPALLRSGITLVVSPLIALMQDQVRLLQGYGIAATFINSSLPSIEISARLEAAARGQYKLLYLAPERILQSDFLNTVLSRWVSAPGVDALVIDEAHCVSEWGHDFRREYRQLAQVRRRYPQIPVFAFTATATGRVREDIVSQLELNAPALHVASFNRSNLFYSVRPKTKQTYAELLQRCRDAGTAGGSGIIYCLSRKRVDELSTQLRSDGVAALPYHAGLSNEQRRDNQDAFINDDAKVIVATIAFGMGINKPDVRWVVHHDLPRTLESYYQESGRAGRDGDPADCVLYFSPGDIRSAEFLIQQKIDPITGEPLVEEQRIARQQLRQVLRYAESTECRRAVQLQYFGETFMPPCSACDNCLTPTLREDRTTEAQQFLSCIARLAQRQERYGASHVIDILRGAETQRVLSNGHAQLSVYGIGKHHSIAQWRAIGRSLLHQGLLSESEDGYGVLTLNASSWEVLRGQRPVHIHVAARKDSAKSARANSEPELSQEDHALFDALRGLRKRIAQDAGLPPYVIFHDATLRRIAERRPAQLDDFLSIAGIGQTKLERYGPAFLQEVQRHLSR